MGALSTAGGEGEAKSSMPATGSSAACVCGEINTRHCPVHGQGETYKIEPLSERPSGGGDIPPSEDDPRNPTDVEAWGEVDH